MHNNLDYLLSLLENLQDPNQEKLLKLYKDLIRQFPDAKWSSNNKHQWRDGWYYDHIADSLKFGKIMYDGLDTYRKLPFTFNDVIVVIALHDLEKPFKYTSYNQEYDYLLALDNHGIRDKVMEEYSITLSPVQQNGLDYIHGEWDHYSKTERIQWPLAAFCHSIDTISARIYFNDGK